MYSWRLCGGLSRRVSSVSSISACMAAVASTMQSMKSLMNLLAVVAILMRSPSNMFILMRDCEYVIPKRPFMSRSRLSSPLEEFGTPIPCVQTVNTTPKVKLKPLTGEAMQISYTKIGAIIAIIVIATLCFIAIKREGKT